MYSKNPELKKEVDKRIIWFQNNPQDTRLRNHLLIGRMSGKWSFSITGDIRIVYEWIGKTTVRFLAIGGHQKVYKRKNSG
ncbi:MAG: hypothetical protein Q7R97_01410 [Candidatus Daviesbacteria bacterium]|nr:hypothetical protein [Candidatus Daviesbacteria bacterium]